MFIGATPLTDPFRLFLSSCRHVLARSVFGEDYQTRSDGTLDAGAWNLHGEREISFNSTEKVPKGTQLEVEITPVG